MQFRKTPRPRTNWLGLMLAMACAGGLLYWTLQTGRETETIYDGIYRANSNQLSIVATAEGQSSTVIVPSWDWFHTGQLWEYISAKTPRKQMIEGALVQPTVKASTEGDMRIDSRMKPALSQLFAAAQTDGIDLMLSSAYRTRDDQQNLYDLYLVLKGRAYVDSYIAQPGSSEHETGLAVDIASSSPACQKDSDACTLEPAAIAWLHQNAPRFGFLQRYPTGKQSITGVAGEAWHYRYVGVPLAQFLDKENLTFDEFVTQIAPGYTKPIAN